MLKKKRNFAQKIGHGYSKYCKGVSKWTDKHEGLVGGLFIAAVAAPIVVALSERREVRIYKEYHTEENNNQNQQNS